MSKHMQLTVSVQPYYRDDLKTLYPKTAAHLGRVDKALIEEDPSLYDLVGRLDKLLYALDGDAAFKQILLDRKDQLVDLHEKIERHIADWDLARADKALYALEDLFEEIEWAADKL